MQGAVLTKIANIFGGTVIAMMTGLGLVVFVALGIAGLDLNKAAVLWGSFLTHWAAADADSQRRAILPAIALWFACSAFVGFGLASPTRRKGARD